MDKIGIVRRAIRASLKIKEYKDLIADVNNLKCNLKQNGLSIHSLDLIQEDLDKKIRLYYSYIKNRIYTLIYDGKVPFSNEDKKIFGETKTVDGLIYINYDAVYYSIDYISSFDLKRGYIEFTELIEESLVDIKYKYHVLNLHTGEFTTKPEKLVEKPVDTSAYVRFSRRQFVIKPISNSEVSGGAHKALVS